MSEEELDPKPNGMRIKTTELDSSQEKNWGPGVLDDKRWGVEGVIKSSYLAFLYIYLVVHDDGSEAPYLASEFTAV
jgi:hypothetical protein